MRHSRRRKAPTRVGKQAGREAAWGSRQVPDFTEKYCKVPIAELKAAALERQRDVT